MSDALSLVGIWLNVRKCRWCFVVWLGSNALWAGWGAWQAAWGLVIAQATFAAFGVWGFLRWGRDR